MDWEKRWKTIEVTRAEDDLIELVRGEDGGENFTLIISLAEGRWVVQTKSPGLDGAQGEGATFNEAWHRQDPMWLDSRTGVFLVLQVAA